MLYVRLKIWLFFALPSVIAYASEISDEPADSESGAASLIFSGWIGESIWTLVSFVALLLVLWKFAWGPLLTALNSRADFIKNEISSAQLKNTEANETLDQYKQKLASADEEALAMIKKQLSQAESKAMDIIEKARLEAKAIKTRSRVEIEKSHNNARLELLQEAGGMVFQLGSHILSRNISEQDNQQLIDEAIDKFKNSNTG